MNVRCAIACAALVVTAPLALAETESDAMRDARHHVHHHHGGKSIWFVHGDRLDWKSGDGDPIALWDIQGWYGTDEQKFWIKTEGEYELDDSRLEEAELQALYSRPIRPFFDMQFGLRHDFEPGPSRTFAVAGLQGLAPYLFEIDAAAFLSDDGDLSARVEAEYEVFLTQRLILQPRAELDFALQDVPEVGVGSGLSTADIGLRLRYEFKREIAPYIGVSWSRMFGDTADFARADGEDTRSTSLVAGLRFWF